MFGLLHHRPLDRRDHEVACILFKKRYLLGPYDENETFWYLTWLWRNAQTDRLNRRAFCVKAFRPINQKVEFQLEELLGALVRFWYCTKKQATWLIWLREEDRRLALAMGLHQHLQRSGQTCPFLYGSAMEDILARICLTDKISDWYVPRNYLEDGF